MCNTPRPDKRELVENVFYNSTFNEIGLHLSQFILNDAFAGKYPQQHQQ